MFAKDSFSEYKEITIEELDKIQDEIYEDAKKSQISWGAELIVLQEIVDGVMYFRLEEWEC